jgi:DNA-binding FadR family transcriptional regulator
VIKNVHGNTVDFIGEAIVAGRYAAGATLPSEAVLGEELGVSRTVVRESVKSLIAKGLVTTGPKVGTRVQASENWNWFDPDVTVWQVRAGLSPEFLRDLLDLRKIVEPGAVRLAAERATAADIAELESAYAGMARAVQEGGDYVTHDLRFHQVLLGSCHNRMMIQMTRALNALLRTSFELSIRKKDGPRLSLPLHLDVLNAVAAHKPDRAERAILSIIDGARQDIDVVLASRRRLPRLRHPAPFLSAR